MSYFCGGHKLVPAPKDVKMIIAYIVLFNLLVCCSRCLSLSLPAGIPIQEDPYYNPLMSSREDMAQIAGYGEEKLSTVLITGSVHCEEACEDMHPDDDTTQTTSTDPDHDHQPRLHAWPLSGALVSVHCHVSGRNKRKSSFAQGFTDEFGDFMIDLPSNLHAIPDLGKTCSVRVLRIPKSTQCRPAYVRRHKGLKLSSVGNGIRTYNAGRIRFQHLTTKPSTPCINKVSNNERMLS